MIASDVTDVQAGSGFLKHNPEPSYKAQAGHGHTLGYVACQSHWSVMELLTNTLDIHHHPCWSVENGVLTHQTCMYMFKI